MPKQRKWQLPQNDSLVNDDDGDDRLLTPDGEWEIPTSMEEMMGEVGLSFKDYYAERYE